MYKPTVSLVRSDNERAPLRNMDVIKTAAGGNAVKPLVLGAGWPGITAMATGSLAAQMQIAMVIELIPVAVVYVTVKNADAAVLKRYRYG